MNIPLSSTYEVRYRPQQALLHANSCTESGEVPELMPGDLIEHSRQPTPTYDDVPYYLTTLQKWLSRLSDVSVYMWL
jgi:hypothetical protein